jgi:hypothetical protein
VESEKSKVKSRSVGAITAARQRILSGEVAVIGRTTLVVVLALMFQWQAGAAQHSGQPTGRPSDQCLNDEAKDIIKKLKSLNRPTTKDDPIPPFDPDYFVGTWVMEWEQPESPFGNGGMLTGTLAINYRLRTQISADGEPYVNFGNPWFRKQDVPAAAVR